MGMQNRRFLQTQLMLISIWFVMAFSSTGDSDHLILSTSKECSNPNIIGWWPCYKENLLGFYFDIHRSLSDLDFNKFLTQEFHLSDSCERVNDNAISIGISSLLRHLVGEGYHRQLVTTMVFCHHPEFSHWIKDHFCVGVIVERLPIGVFADPFELQHLAMHGAFLGASVLGDTNLELPSALSNRSVVEIHFEVWSDNIKIVLQLPLHARYPPLDSSGYANITIGRPDLFLRCRPKETNLENCSWALIDLGYSFGNSVQWRIPCGIEGHTRAVTAVTFLSAFICSLSILFSIILFSRKNNVKV
ncbi:hypothetical protein AXF42_Ash001585 [Apostasia shenzhenica]|uniref:Phosphatidylinositol-glycan biosynthesis class X protein n=1 Tax=Apostasia shenzhenica TaxID=1088818 RepID=A0A2I0AAN6_9ASPA|nr:hypothetical protein AXF42_Ash001585 [Apostasia shenzhenica]